jgi:LysM repeat protein
MRTNEFLTELSNEKLGQYKTAAGKDASKADKAGNFKQGDKRLKGINTATKKQFANDAKKVTENKQFVLNESLLMEDPIYRQFKDVGKYLVERRLSKEEIYQLFADAETGMTNKDTGANRSFLGRGKDTAGKALTSVKDAVSGVLDSIQKSVPISAVDVAYDQATEAIGKMTGGDKSAIMKSIIGYRNLVKQYPKTAGFAKAALVAAIGLATGGAGLPAIAGLTYALDSAIRGDKLSSVIGKGAGAAALAYGGQALAAKANAATTPTGPDIPGANPHQLDPSQFQPNPNPSVTPTDFPPGADEIVKTVAKGDTLSGIAKQYQTSVELLQRANPGITNPDALAIGTKVTIPQVNATTYLHGAGTAADTAAKTASGAYDSVPAALAKQVAANRGGVTESIWQENIPSRNKKIIESIAFKKLSAYDLIDKKTTAFNWALNEGIGNKTRNVNLTTLGVYTIFENVDRYRIAVMEAAGVPGSTRPEQYAPHQPGGKGKESKPGLIGRGLNWLDKAAGKVGGALSNFGHQFTTNVTKEKLKMNWTQKGEPSDSDQLADFMKEQGVPEEVISTVYTKMGLPFTPSTPAADPAAAAAPSASSPSDTSTPAATGADDTPASSAGAFGQMGSQMSNWGDTSTSSTGGTTMRNPQGNPQGSGQRSSGGGTSSAGNMQQQSQPNTPREQQVVARTVRQQIDDIMHTVLTQHNDDQPALVKYLRQRLDSSFPVEAEPKAAPKRTVRKKAEPKGKKPDNTIAMPKQGEKIKWGGQEFKPGDPMYDKMQAAAGTNESVGLHYPETYEQTNDKFKSKGQRRIGTLTTEEEKQRLDPKCWTGYKKQGTKMKGNTRVNNCVPVKESAILSGVHQVNEGWKSALGSAALAGAMALGGAAHGRVLPDQDPGINRLTGKPVATQVAQDDEKPAAKAPSGYSAEYLQSIIDGSHPRPMLSVEKAKQLLQQQGQQ